MRRTATPEKHTAAVMPEHPAHDAPATRRAPAVMDAVRGEG